ncbi:MAG: ACP S-malonyltransferase [Desulfovibrio sp.]|nr:ACP S-malonyltransferase [Desulfovibrio sp.]
MLQPVLLFPGQGAQVSGMGRDLAEYSADAMNLWKQAEQISRLPLREIFWEGDESAISDTRALQPALTVVNLNLWTAMADKIAPCGAAGHSLGELSALAAAQALPLKDVLEIAVLRGSLMAEADPDAKGGMAAIVKLSLEQVQEVVKEVSSTSGELLLVANYNTPTQFVISGVKEAVALACGKARERRGRGIELKVGGAFHSPMMREAAKELTPLLRRAHWQKPRFPVYCNSNGKPARNAENAQNCLIEQMTSPVRWIEAICSQYEDGARCWLELGPKSVLGKMIAPCLARHNVNADDLNIMSASDLQSVQNLGL